MKKKLCVSSALLVTLIFWGWAHARSHKLPKLDMKVDLPAEWQVQTQGDMLMAMPDSEDLVLVFFEAADLDSLDDIGEALDEELDKFIKEPKMTDEPIETKINGLDAILIDGKGKAEGQRVEWSMGIIHNGKGKFLLMLGFAEPKAVKKYESNLSRIMKSIKRS